MCPECSDVHDNTVYSSPTPYHVEQIMAAVERGKHVFCEKPISNDLEAIDKCIQVPCPSNERW